MGDLLAEGEVLESELAVAADEEGEEPEHVRISLSMARAAETAGMPSRVPRRTRPPASSTCSWSTSRTSPESLEWVARSASRSTLLRRPPLPPYLTAHRQGQLADPRAVLLELRAAGIWLSDAVIARALRIARIEP
jgi:hypothetical protein